MAIIKAKPTAQIPPPPPQVAIAKPDRKSIVVDTQYNPKETLLSHIEGSSWTVSYYSQVLGRDTGAAGQGLATDPTLQQYKRVNGMEIKVTSALTNSQSEETAEMTTTGTAVCYPHVIPNKGDMFTADILDGRLGIFQITSTRRLAIMRDTCHEIDYQLVDYGSRGRIDDLNSKVVQEAYFVKDFVYHGQNPILLGDDYENYQFLCRNQDSLVRNYFKRFYSKEYATLILPDQVEPVYDHFLINVWFQHLDTKAARELVTLRRLVVDDDQAMSAPSIWDLLLHRERPMMQDIFHKSGTVSTRGFQREPVMNGIRYSGIRLAIYPEDPMLTVDNQYTQNTKGTTDFAPVQIPVPNRKSIGVNGEDRTMVGIKNVMEGGYYIFSKEFYENSREEHAQSTLELMVQDYIDGKEISYARMRQLVEASVYWNSLNSFYFVPVLYILMKAVVRTI